MKNFTISKVLNVLLIIVLGAYVVRYFYFKPKFGNGQEAPEIMTELMDGTAFKLSDFQGDYVLLDFWGSWCGPCRRENKDLVAFYEEFEGKTFDSGAELRVVSIAIENKREKWLDAIKQDKLSWKYHISELTRFKSKIAEDYGVKEIPTKYLINPEGMIVGVNLSFKTMKTLLK